jgi:hypothetical protein
MLSSFHSRGRMQDPDHVAGRNGLAFGVRNLTTELTARPASSSLMCRLRASTQFARPAVNSESDPSAVLQSHDCVFRWNQEPDLRESIGHEPVSDLLLRKPRARRQYRHLMRRGRHPTERECGGGRLLSNMGRTYHLDLVRADRKAPEFKNWHFCICCTGSP